MFQFNPVQLSRNRSLSFSVPNAPQTALVEGETERSRQLRVARSRTSLRQFHGRFLDLLELQESQIVNVQEESISFEIRLDATDKLNEGDPITEQFGIAPQLSTLELMVYPKDESKDFIRRVIGVEGDKIAIKDKNLYINDELYDDPYGFYREHTIIPAHVQPRDNYVPVVVPRDSLFVMGDNRDRSADSRFWGFVRLNKVRGKAFLIYWSWGGFMRDIKWSRIANLIH